MNIYRLVAVLVIGFFLTSCARMAGYKSDYNVLGSADIKKMMVGKTIDYRLAGKHFITYYSSNGKYFTLYLSNNTSGFKETNIYDKGTWYVTDSTVRVSQKSYKIGKICKRTNLSSSTISQLSTGCNEVMMNGGNWYLNNLTTKPFHIHNGSSIIFKNILNIQHKNVKALNAYESMFGKNPSVSAKKEKVLREIRIKKEHEKMEKEKRKRARAERESRRAQQKASRSTNSYSGSSRYISKLGYCTTKLTHNSLWSRGCITLNDGSTIWANLLKSGGCYSLLVGSNESNIYGNCSNCSSDLGGYWSCHAGGGGSFSFRGNQAEATNAIVQRCN